jgi:hypothetical protein
MSTALPATVRICPECQADNSTAATKCWVCRGSLAHAPEVVYAELLAEPAAKSKFWPAWIAAAVVLAVSGLAIVPVFSHSPGLGVLFGLIWVVALVAILLARPVFRTSLDDSARAAASVPPTVNYYAPPAALPEQHPPPQFKYKTGWEIARDVLLILGAIALVLVGSFVALCVACFAIFAAMMSGTH